MQAHNIQAINVCQCDLKTDSMTISTIFHPQSMTEMAGELVGVYVFGQKGEERVQENSNRRPEQSLLRPPSGVRFAGPLQAHSALSRYVNDPAEMDIWEVGIIHGPGGIGWARRHPSFGCS